MRLAQHRHAADAALSAREQDCSAIAIFFPRSKASRDEEISHR
jgi:hypothetical protein